ncbi:universal stress protein [Ornithobacterium rhinotracheale]|nr:universal stress protein [Ornithobacterium rhinotracheale]MRJ10184.1 universal stress protein [Ornithobacterium rhinotracheale]
MLKFRQSKIKVMKKLLVPIDLSEFSKEIIDEAVKLAKLSDAEVILLNVASLDVGFIVGDVGFQYMPELEETALEEDAKTLTEFTNYVNSQGVQCRSMVKQGIPVDVILEQAKEQNIDCIVIGSKGHGSLYEALVGSVCHDVIKYAKIPVHVKPNNKKD